MCRMVMEFFTFRMRRRMSNQRPRAAERPSADDDETVEDLVPISHELPAVFTHLLVAIVTLPQVSAALSYMEHAWCPEVRPDHGPSFFQLDRL